ncbi:MAG: hypothetical protein NT129_02855 [Candidatus Aenigmarchaeota archaeon]|nr:hypothetical protein [Candidatus Aenigmarchaeota archaeon]
MQSFKKYLENGIKIIKEKGPYLGALGLFAAGSIFGAVGCSEKLLPPPTVTYERMGEKQFELDPKFADHFTLVDGQTLINEYGIDYQTLTKGLLDEFPFYYYNKVIVYGKGLVGDLDNDGNEEVFLITDFCGKSNCSDYFTICRMKDGNLTRINTVPSGRTIGLPDEFIFRDTNSDGNLELISPSLGQWVELFVYGNLMNPGKVLNHPACGGGPYSPTYVLHIKDIDCDGSDEIWINGVTSRSDHLWIFFTRDSGKHGSYTYHSSTEAPAYGLKILNDLNNSPAKKNMTEAEKMQVLGNIRMTFGDQVMWEIVRHAPVYDEETGWMPFEPYMDKKAAEYEKTCNSEWLESTSFGKKENLYKVLTGSIGAEDFANDVFGKKYKN